MSERVEQILLIVGIALVSLGVFGVTYFCAQVMENYFYADNLSDE